MTELEKEAREQADKIEKRQKRCRYSIDESYVAGYEDGYIEGAEAHQTRWHKLRKNPEDLPPVGMVVFVSGYLGDMKDLHGFDEWDGEKWLNEDMPGFVRVAWCELPKFKEE